MPLMRVHPPSDRCYSQRLIKSVEGAEKIFREELRRLGTDHIDYYLMHMLTDAATCLRLIVEPLERQRGRREPARLEEGLGGLGQQVHQPPAPQGLHDDNGQSLGVGVPQPLHSGLRGLVHVVVLNLAEIPVIGVHQLLEREG